ncbi:MAG: DUF4136 domain-containing protein [Dyadobacter sp.]|uniref:DUF4136 domain-containing protein n=1 Tax=Dyadobacter sp. TaxID=1914288 RepID=UPI001B01D8A3|nr:DUF4136 domain-containing protein [Dyadobacter sp.]MBO9611748.1 DUF4136 domain-containing protein [Dyadobacter sp.]
MKTNMKWAVLAMSIFFAACSTGYKQLKTSKEAGFSVRDYQTFNLQYTFPEGADTLAPLFAESKALATKTIASHMKDKGLVKSDKPELMVNLSVKVQEKSQTRQTDFRTDGLPRYMGQRRYSWKSEEIEIGKYQEGTLILDVIDTKNDRLVWRSGIKGVLPENTIKAEAGLTAAINDLMGKLQ